MLAAGVFVCCHNEHMWKTYEKYVSNVYGYRTTVFILRDEMSIFWDGMLTKFMCFVCDVWPFPSCSALVVCTIWCCRIQWKLSQMKITSNKNSCWLEFPLFLMHQMFLSYMNRIECFGFVLLADYFTNGTRKYKIWSTRIKNELHMRPRMCRIYVEHIKMNNIRDGLIVHITCFDWNKNAKKHLPC